MNPFILALTLAILIPGPALADVLVGRVVGIADGDTITVVDSAKEQHKIRLMGIDAPEKGQAFGERSKANLSRLVFDQAARVEWTKRDRYQRIVGKVVVNDQDVNLEQVRAGMAWWYRDYAKEQPPKDRDDYEVAEFKAKSVRVGLWSDKNPLPPWVWRRQKRMGN